MHMQEARQNGLQLTYELLDLDLVPEGAAALERLLREAESAGFAGVNVTHPCKQTVMQHLHELSEHAQTLGAVNTVVFHKGRRVGHNTDWFGFAEGFRRGMSGVSTARVTQLGAGGAGSAVAYAMLRMGVGKLAILDTERNKASHLVEALGEKFGKGRIQVIESVADELPRADGLINTTPMGMARYPGLPLPADLLRPSLWVAEVVYFPLETALLKAARALGCRTMDGGAMAVFQAAESFRLFTGVTPNADRMLEWFRANYRS